MKIRNGFVSNSSSSSFIIGIVNVKDKPGDLTIDLDRQKLPWEIASKRLDNGKIKLTIESFTYDSVSCEVEDGDNIVYMYDSGDDNFKVYDEDGDYIGTDYDSVDLDNFEDDAVDKYNTISAAGGDVSYGAGRDG